MPTVHLPGNSVMRATVLIGSARVAKALKTKTDWQRALSTTTKVLRIAGEDALALPNAWLSRFWPFENGTLLARAGGAPGTYPEMLAVEDATEEAHAAVKRWRRVVSSWASPRQPVGILVSPKQPVFTRAIPLERGTYAIDSASAKARGIPFAFYRFVCVGEEPAAVAFSPRKTKGPRVLSADALRHARKPRFVDTEGGPLLFGDKALVETWGGSTGAPSDYDRICKARDLVDVGKGRALVLDGPAGTTWIAQPWGGLILRLGLTDDAAVAIVAASELGASHRGWRTTKLSLIIGNRGARLLDAAAPGERPRPKEVLDARLLPGRYAIARAKLEGAVVVAGKRSAYSIEVIRLRRA